MWVKKYLITTILAFFLFKVVLAQKNTKPNILCLVMEDTSPDYIGCYGNKQVITPVIDKLAAEGVRFVNAFSTNTVCSPSRSCIITGVPPYKLGTGNHRSAYSIPDTIHGFPFYLRQAGYYTSNNSKTDYNTNAEKRIINESWDENSVKASWEKRKPGQPFFAVFNFLDSHESRTITNPYSIYKTQVLDQLPANRIITEENVPLPPFLPDAPEIRKEYVRIHNAISLADLKMGQVLAKLEAQGLKDSTIIFMYADHGEAMPRGKTNGINRGYRVPFVIWFPAMYKHLSPWGTAGVVSDELISFEDLAPTMIALAEGKKPNYLEGRTLIGTKREKNVDLLFLAQDRSGESPDLVRSVTDGRFMYSRNYMSFMPEMRYMKYHDFGRLQQLYRIAFDEGKLSTIQKIGMIPRPAEYLFDIKNDSWELNNLAANASHIAVLHKMRTALEKHVLQSKDIHFLPEYEMDQVNNKMHMYDFRQDAENYPITKIYEVAQLSGFKGTAYKKKQLNYLTSKHQIQRYWGAMGLLSQNNLEKKDLKIIEIGLKDKYPPVQIICAALVYKYASSKEARDILLQFINNKNPLLQVEALQQLTYMKDVKAFIPSIKNIHANAKAYELSVANAAEVFLYKFANQVLVYDNFQ